MTHTQILINQLRFILPTGKIIFDNLNFVFSRHKTGLVGRNGVGKSTLMNLMLGNFFPTGGSIQVEGKLAYVPQTTSFAENVSVAHLLNCEEKINALHRIMQGSIDTQDYILLNEEWDVEERIQKWLSLFGIHYLSHNRLIKDLSGGEMTRLFLVKAFLSNADFLLLDEPTNHLDKTAREQLYSAIQQWQGGLIVISHDRALLNLMDEIVELTTLGINCYGGNYDYYEEQKEIETTAQDQRLQDAKKSLQKAKNTIQLSREKHEKKQSYGRELRRSGSIDKMAANAKKGRSERTQSKLLIKEERLLNQTETELQFAKEKIEVNEKIKINLPETNVPRGKVILDIEDLIFSYPEKNNLIDHFSMKVIGPARIALSGDNGSGKTTLIRLILNQLKPTSGRIYLGTNHAKYLDQNASLLNVELSILDNFLQLNPEAKENDAYQSLAQFLFRNTATLKLVKELSGGEKLRALLACVLMSKHPPQLLILDEPTNHLDLHSIKSIESALNNYQGTLIIISHDTIFLENIRVEKIIAAPFQVASRIEVHR